ncbi:MAG: IcmT/TraK family protein [Deltaproteobacteria bacterium]|jgi:hypothetical protein|nr:IcmT/TraK family protein [Deltaproteobacteria bacterium]
MTKIPWRDTARPVRIGVLDARVLVCFVIFILYMSKLTFFLSILSVILFFVFEQFGVAPAAAWRFMRHAPFSNLRVRRSLYTVRRNSR